MRRFWAQWERALLVAEQLAGERLSGMPPQLSATNGAFLRGDISCRACATSSLPVPVSPRIRRSTGEPAISSTSRRTRSICGERPISLPVMLSRWASV